MYFFKHEINLETKAHPHSLICHPSTKEIVWIFQGEAQSTLTIVSKYKAGLVYSGNIRFSNI